MSSRVGGYIGIFGVASMLVAGCADEERSNEQDQATGQVAAESKWDSSASDALYVADVANDSVKKFNAKTGAFEGAFVTPASGGLFGPRGIVFGKQGNLLVANQNVDQPFAGEIFRYAKGTGAFIGAAVPKTNPNAPYAPRGIVSKSGKIFVADMGEPGYVLAEQPPPSPLPARVSVFDESSSEWLGNIAYGGFDMQCPMGKCTQWSPRALVFGPDRALYVSLMKFTAGEDPNVAPGRVLKITEYGTTQVFVDGDTCGCGLSRPEGLAFGPNGKLYVTSYRKGELDTDKILVFNGKTGAYEDKIDLDAVAQPRAFAQAIVFGPKGKLFAPISGNGPDTGSVRRYDVTTKSFDVFVAAGGPLQAGWYATFGNTDSATLEYEGKSDREPHQDHDRNYGCRKDPKPQNPERTNGKKKDDEDSRSENTWR